MWIFQPVASIIKSKDKMMKIQSLVIIAIGLAFTAVYACFQTRVNYSDGLGFAYDLENYPLSYGFRQHHPLWLPITHIIYYIMRSIIPGLRALTFLSVFNAFSGGLAVILIIRLLDRLTQNLYASTLAGIFLGVTWGMMIDCTDADIYVFMLVMILAVMTILTGNEELTRKDAIIATSLTLFASLVHQMFFFYTPLVLAAIWIRSPRFQRKNTAIICTGLYGVIISLVNYIIYLYSISVVKDEIKIGFYQWLTAFGHIPTWWTAKNLGFWRTLEVFNFQQMSLFIHNQGSELTNHADIYNAAYASPVSVIIHVVIVTTILWEIIRLCRDKDGRISYHHVRILALVWLLPFYVFNHFFSAPELHYKVLYLPPLIVLWTLNLVELPLKYHRTIGYSVSLLLVFMFVWNLTTGMLPNSNPKSNSYLVPVLDIAPLVRKGDLIILSERQGYMSFLARVYTDADASTFRRGLHKYATNTKTADEIDRYTVEFLKSKFNRIFLTDDAYRRLPKFLYFPERRFPPPHSWLLGISSKSIQEKNILVTEKHQVLHEVQLK